MTTTDPSILLDAATEMPPARLSSDATALGVNAVTLLVGDSGCLAGDTVITVNRNGASHRRTLADACRRHDPRSRDAKFNPAIPTRIRSLLVDRIGLHTAHAFVYRGVKPVYRLRLHDGPTLTGTADHPIWTPDGWVGLGDLQQKALVLGETTSRPVARRGEENVRGHYLITAALPFHPYADTYLFRGRPAYRVPVHRLVAEARLNGIDYHTLIFLCRYDKEGAAHLQFLDPAVYAVHHKDQNVLNNGARNLEVLTHADHWRLHANVAHFHQGELRSWRVRSVERVGCDEETFDVVCADPHRNFVANQIIVHNSGKSTLAATAAEYIHERSTELFGTAPASRRIMRLYSADPGGYPTRVQALVKFGLIEVWQMRNHAAPFAACELASLGYWPTTIDRLSGRAPASVKLLPPVIPSFHLHCPKGHLIKTVHIEALIKPSVCPTCAAPVALQQLQVKREQALNPDFLRVGGIFVDGLTSWSDWIMGDMAQRVAHNKLGGEASALGGVIESDGMVFGQNNRAHFGFAQVRAQFWCSNLATIPHLILPPIMTALEDRGSDESKSPIYGPKIAGSAKTYQIPSWVGNCLRTAVVKNDAGVDEWRLYLRQHSFAHEGHIPHLAKTRSESAELPEYLADVDESRRPLPRFSRFSLNYFFRLLDSALATTLSDYERKYQTVTPFATTSQMDPRLLAELTGEPVVAPSTQASTTSLPAGAPKPVAALSPGGSTASLVPTPRSTIPSGQPVVKKTVAPPPTAIPPTTGTSATTTSTIAAAPLPPSTPTQARRVGGPVVARPGPAATAPGRSALPLGDDARLPLPSTAGGPQPIAAPAPPTTPPPHAE